MLSPGWHIKSAKKWGTSNNSNICSNRSCKHNIKGINHEDQAGTFIQKSFFAECENYHSISPYEFHWADLGPCSFDVKESQDKFMCKISG